VSAPTTTTPPIPRRALLASGRFSARVGPEGLAAALARGLRAGGAPRPDIAALEREDDAGVLAELDFDSRMRAARAVIIAAGVLDAHAIARGVAFEIATRARQAGVPAYAVARETRFGSFDARLLDLQLVLQARTPRALSAAGRQLARVL